APLSNFSIDTVGLTHGTPDENVKAALRTAAEYGKIPRERGEKEERKPRVFAVPGKKRPPVETTLRSASRTVTIGPDHPLVLIGERINPTGRPGIWNVYAPRPSNRLRPGRTSWTSTSGFRASTKRKSWPRRCVQSKR
ncbi:MAG: hypothetical protein JRJ16_17180, partial [Deltaproteobacteria bacterium]|nr:hypothetical protein [Deltaproteobacteria bacterium]